MKSHVCMNISREQWNFSWNYYIISLSLPFRIDVVKICENISKMTKYKNTHSERQQWKFSFKNARIFKRTTRKTWKKSHQHAWITNERINCMKLLLLAFLCMQGKPQNVKHKIISPFLHSLCSRERI